MAWSSGYEWLPTPSEDERPSLCGFHLRNSPDLDVNGRFLVHMCSRALRGAQVLIGEIPIDQMPQECGDVVEASMLKVEIVGVLPHIDRQQRHLRRDQRCVRIGGGDDLQPVVLEHEPRPAAAELIARRGDELLAESALTAEGVLDQPRRSRRVASPPPPGRMLCQKNAWFHACAAALKEPLLRLALEADDLVKLGGFEWCASDQRARLLDIGGMMISMMRSQRAPRKMRLKGVERHRAVAAV